MFKRIKNRIKKRLYRPFIAKKFPLLFPVGRLNLCSGGRKISGYTDLDICDADIVVNLSQGKLPLPDSVLDSVVCMSAINYFTYARGGEIIAEVYRTLKPGGITRFGVQDLERIARWYVEKNNEFFFEKLPNGKERFEGVTLGDKFNGWFYGYVSAGGACKYFYDYDSLATHFKNAGFKTIERREYLDSRLDHIQSIDNRPEQMFYLEAIK
jgi:predicted SAM-dependent methyltransferase